MAPQASQTNAEDSAHVADNLQSLLVDEIQESGMNAELNAWDAQPLETNDFSSLQSTEPPTVMGFEQSPTETPNHFEVPSNGSIGEEIPEIESNEDSKTPQVIVNHLQNDVSSHDLTAMNEFANAPDISLPLRYDLVISGVDTEAEIEILKEALTDQRLALDRMEIFDSMKNGQARVNNLNPVKAAILFQRLRFEPFVIEVVEKTI